jgi:uncharacterized protein YlxP (DUF503 family)
MKILIDKDMLLMDLYELRKHIMEAALISDDAKEAKDKLDKVVQMIQTYPDAEVTSSFPKTRLKR